MTITEIRQRCPRSYEAWRLHNEEAMSRGPIAARLKVAPETVDKQIRRVEELLAKSTDASTPRLTDVALLANGRCPKCKLLRPCVCLTPVWVHAAQRPNAGT